METNFGVGVKYCDSDYVGLFSRLVIICVDLIVVGAMLLIGVEIDSIFLGTHEEYDNYYIFYAMLVMAFVYLTAIKASKFGTLGQLITRTRIETIYGDKPKQIHMTLRLLFWTFGPLNLVGDVLFLALNREKRAVRDCMCNTIVVKKSAEPIDVDIPIHLTRVFALGMYLMYQSCNSDSA